MLYAIQCFLRNDIRQIVIEFKVGANREGQDKGEFMRGICTACHSAKLITQQRGTAQQWLTMIRRMQQKPKLWQFDPDTEERIMTYLSEDYPPDAASLPIETPW